MHPKIDEQIEAIDTRIQRMMESTDPVKEEVDDLTGAAGEALPYTEENIKADIDIIEPKVKIADVESIRNTLPDEQANTRTQATQKILDYFAETMDIPKFTEELNKGTYIKWLQESGIGDTGYKVSELLNNPKRAFDVITDFSRTKKQFAKPIEEAIAEKVPDAEFESFVDRGTVPQDRIQSIAMKVKENQPLSERETAIFTAKTGDVNKILETVRAQETVAEPVVEAPKPLTRVQIARELDRLDYPVDAYGIALKALAEGRKVNYESFKAETGGKSEAYSSGFTAKKSQKAPSVEALSESLWEDFVPDEMKQDLTNDQIRNALIDVMTTYKNKTEAARAFVESYSADIKAREEAAALAAEDIFVVENDIAYLRKDYNNWMREIGEIEQAERLTDEYIKSIVQDEKRVAEASKGIAGAEPAKRPETVSGDVIPKETGEVVREYIQRQGTDAEVSDFSEYTNRELSRPDFDAEYNANRRAGESKEEFVLRKYCK